jgi:hypothetical protein
MSCTPFSKRDSISWKTNYDESRYVRGFTTSSGIQRSTNNCLHPPPVTAATLFASVGSEGSEDTVWGLYFGLFSVTEGTEQGLSGGETAWKRRSRNPFDPSFKAGHFKQPSLMTIQHCQVGSVASQGSRNSRNPEWRRLV